MTTHTLTGHQSEDAPTAALHTSREVAEPQRSPADQPVTTTLDDPGGRR